MVLDRYRASGHHPVLCYFGARKLSLTRSRERCETKRTQLLSGVVPVFMCLVLKRRNCSLSVVFTAILLFSRLANPLIRRLPIVQPLPPTSLACRTESSPSLNLRYHTSHDLKVSVCCSSRVRAYLASSTQLTRIRNLANKG